MLKRALLLVPIAIAIALGSAHAIEQPRIVPRSERINRSIEDVYGTLKQYFSDSSLSMFHLQTANETTRVLVAKRSDIDDENWTNWAFCKAGPLQLIYKLQDGSVTVTVNMERSGNNATFVTITADFQGKYALGANEETIACVSKGQLEQNLLTVAGGGTAKKSN